MIINKIKKYKILFIIVIIIFFIYVSYYYFIPQRFICHDGWGENSYFPNPNKLTYEQWKFKAPDDIIQNRVAYIDIDTCRDIYRYFIKVDNTLKRVGRNKFDKFVQEKNSSCGGCLDIYYSGCC